MIMNNRKQSFLFVVLCILAIFLCLPSSVEAIPAYPRPIRVTQPDGSVLTIRLHGDEFLHWTTFNNRFVSRASDGFYYYADYQADGTLVRSKTRVGLQDVSLATASSTPVVPPLAAQQRATQLRFERAAQAMATRANAEKMNFFTHGSYPFLALLVNFKDVKFTSETANQDFFDLLNQEGYSQFGGTGSCRDYYYQNSNGIFDPTFEVYGPVDLPNNMAYYGGNDASGSDKNPRAMVYDGVKAAVETCGLDLSRFDCDGDGVLDNIFIFYAGYGEASGGPEDSIWPHQWVGYGTFNGVSIESYACGAELRGNTGTLIDGIGTFTHEFGHVLGLPDFYDIDYQSNGEARALRFYSLMDSGCYNNDSNTPPYLTSMERHLLGWSEGPVELIESGSYALDPVQENSSFWTPTDNEGEYYMYEYRDQTGWDAYIPEKGVLIYHVDQSDNTIGGWMTAEMMWAYGSINSYASHQCFDLIEAVGEENVYDEREVPYPGLSGNTVFDADSYPAAVDWAGNPTNYNLSNITSQGTFDLAISQGMRVAGRVRNAMRRDLADASVTAWNVVTKEQYETTTDGDGTYALDILRNPTYVQATAPGYLRQVRFLEGTKSNYSQENFLLQEATGDPMFRLEKYRGMPAGVVEAPKKAYVGVGLLSEELAAYNGFSVAGVEFLMNPAMACPAKVGAFVYDRTTEKMLVEQPVEVQETMESAVWVDLLGAGISLDATHAYVYGYYYEGTSEKAPVLVDAEADAQEGALVSEDGRTWKTLAGGDVMVTLGLDEPDMPSTFPMIFVNGPVYQAGERLRLRLRPCDQEPEDIMWMVNGRVYETGDRVVLESGTTEIRALLTFSDGSRQTLIQEIQVM